MGPSATLALDWRSTFAHIASAAMAIRASSRRSRLPFARPQALQTLTKVRPAPQGQGTPTSPTRATPARTSHHKATAIAEGHPPAAAMASYGHSRLPFAKSQTPQSFQCLSNFCHAQPCRPRPPQPAVLLGVHSVPFVAFLLHNAVLHPKLLPTDRLMIYSPGLHVTGPHSNLQLGGSAAPGR